MPDVTPATGLKTVQIVNGSTDTQMVVGYKLAPTGHVGSTVQLTQQAWETAVAHFGDPTGKANVTITFLSPAQAHTIGTGVTVTTTATTGELNALHSQGCVAADFAKLHALGAVVANAASSAAHLSALKVNYTTGDLDTEAEIISALNATNTRINAVVTALQTFGVFAAS